MRVGEHPDARVKHHLHGNKNTTSFYCVMTQIHLPCSTLGMAEQEWWYPERRSLSKINNLGMHECLWQVGHVTPGRPHLIASNPGQTTSEHCLSSTINPLVDA
jgi:hypothetical protein